MSDLENDVRQALGTVRHPEIGKTVLELDMVTGLEVHGGRVRFTLEELTAASPVKDRTLAAVRDAVSAVPGVSGVEIQPGVRQRSTRPALGGGALDTVKNILAVASGKGGVGKSTVATNLATALALEGAAVGLMDVDIYGPSIPALMGVDQRELRIKDNQIVPVEKFGLKIMSMGLLMKPGESVIWRGPMLHGMVKQFCSDVQWGELDFLVVDLPPGTGDVSLSLSQLVPLGGSIIVSTPQEVALGVATKAVNMFEKLNVPVIGLVENMSYYACPHCGGRDDLFGHGGARKAAEDLGVPFLGEIPLNSAVRTAGDHGVPVVVEAPDSAPAQALLRVARLAAGRLTVAAELGYDALLQNLPE
ncbi:MAG: Mrp/NBP35 family ATP-binding protein [Armatimonadetes bacterium]|nr:Mrp/NBP35 family ATP-binding protein [Armatimonadota bacterium]